MEQAQEAKKPKQPRKPKVEIIPLPPPAEIRLGSISVADPKAMIHRAAELATALAEIIHRQELYVMIGSKKRPNEPKKKYVKADGWTTLGAMLGVVPVEEECEPLPEGRGYKAKIKLIRVSDGGQVGGASAICKSNETNWADRDSYTLHSMAITRATGKAFRLSFAWIMKLAGFEPTPADELFEVEGSEEEKDAAEKGVIEKQLGQTFSTVAEAREAAAATSKQKKSENKLAKVSAFITWPESHNGHKFLLSGKTAIMEHSLMRFVEETCAGKWNERDCGWYVTAEYAPGLRQEFAEKKCPIIERDYTGLLKESIAQAKAKSSDGVSGKSKASPVPPVNVAAPSEIFDQREPGDEFEPQVPLG